jgi:threonine/homoserine/homoserine lactone efflux protein
MAGKALNGKIALYVCTLAPDFVSPCQTKFDFITMIHLVKLVNVCRICLFAAL